MTRNPDSQLYPGARADLRSARQNPGRLETAQAEHGLSRVAIAGPSQIVGIVAGLKCNGRTGNIALVKLHLR